MCIAMYNYVYKMWVCKKYFPISISGWPSMKYGKPAWPCSTAIGVFRCDVQILACAGAPKLY